MEYIVKNPLINPHEPIKSELFHHALDALVKESSISLKVWNWNVCLNVSHFDTPCTCLDFFILEFTSNNNFILGFTVNNNLFKVKLRLEIIKYLTQKICISKSHPLTQKFPTDKKIY